MIQPSDDWYRPDIPRKELKELMRRDDGKGLIDFGIWGLCLAASGYAAYCLGWQPLGDSRIFRLRHDLQFMRCSLARMRPRHSVQDTLAQ